MSEVTPYVQLEVKTTKVLKLSITQMVVTAVFAPMMDYQYALILHVTSRKQAVKLRLNTAQDSFSKRKTAVILVCVLEMG